MCPLPAVTLTPAVPRDTGSRARGGPCPLRMFGSGAGWHFWEILQQIMCHYSSFGTGPGPSDGTEALGGHSTADKPGQDQVTFGDPCLPWLCSPWPPQMHGLIHIKVSFPPPLSGQAPRAQSSQVMGCFLVLSGKTLPRHWGLLSALGVVPSNIGHLIGTRCLTWCVDTWQEIMPHSTLWIQADSSFSGHHHPAVQVLDSLITSVDNPFLSWLRLSHVGPTLPITPGLYSTLSQALAPGL